MNTESTADDRRRNEAAEWVVRIEAGEFDEATVAQWLTWCNTDARNFKAFESLSAVSQMFDDQRLRGTLSTDAPPRPDIPRTAPAPRTKKWPAAFTRHKWAVAASMVLAMGLMSWFVADRASSEAFAQDLSTSVGATTRRVLPDGSIVELGSRSAVRVRLTHDRRDIFIDEGEAFFQVAKHPHRPFVVQAGAVRVVAIGTAFNVRKTDERVVVTINEGTVRVVPDDATAPIDSVNPLAVPIEHLDGQVRAGAGQQVIYSTRQHSLTMTHVDPVEAANNRRTGRLEFVNEPLGSVIAEVNRFSPRPIVLDDAQLKTLVFTGTLRSDAINDWLRGLGEVFPVEVVDQGDKGILITKRLPQ
jgi:transmembrane sensor